MKFLYQEPETNEELLNLLRYVRPGGNFLPTFDLFQKGDVNGAKEDPVFTILKVSTFFSLNFFKLWVSKWTAY